MKFKLKWGGLHKIISGGQTGADQGGLLAALRNDVETGGQAPLGYKTQDGSNPLLEAFNLTQGSDYAGRTKANIAAADGTVIIAHHPGSPGSILTRREAKLAEKPLLELDTSLIIQELIKGSSVDTSKISIEIPRLAKILYDFIVEHQLQILNVAGNREIKVNDSMYITETAAAIVSSTLIMLAKEGKIVTLEDKVDFEL